MSKPLNSYLKRKAFAIFLFSPALAYAQDLWQFNSSINANTGNYIDSRTMNHQHGLGIRIGGEKENRWGFTAGLQATHINMAPINPNSVQRQDNWLLSGHIHQPSTAWLGRWTLKIDAYTVRNDAPYTNTSSVNAVAPQISWVARTKPLKIDLGLASSNYTNTASIYQLSPSIAYGFNNATDWVQIRSHVISNLTPSEALGRSQAHAVETKITHFVGHPSSWAPTSITIGVEHGKKIYWIDMTSQTLYNQPMIDEGGESISASWQLAPKTSLNLLLNQTRYYYHSEFVAAHRFKLNTLSTQLVCAW